MERRVWSVTDPSDPPPLGLSPEQAEASLRTRSHTLHTLLRLSHAPSGGGEGVPGPRSGTPEDRPGRSFVERLAALDDRLRAPRCTDEDAIVDPAGGPIQDFLWAEWAALGGLQASLLARCVRRQQGRRDPLLDGDLSRLERKAEHIATYLRGGAEAIDPPAAYRPSAFANPRGFLAAVLREGAQRKNTEPSILTLDFQVMTEGERSLPGAQVRPFDAVTFQTHCRSGCFTLEGGTFKGEMNPDNVLVFILNEVKCLKCQHINVWHFVTLTKITLSFSDNRNKMLFLARILFPTHQTTIHECLINTVIG